MMASGLPFVCHHVSDGQLADPHHPPCLPLLPVVHHTDIVRLPRFDGVPGSDGKHWVIDTELELGEVREDILERDGNGVAGPDNEGALGFRGEAVAKEGEGIFAPCAGGDDQQGLAVTEVGGFKGHLNAGGVGGGHDDGLLHVEIRVVNLHDRGSDSLVW